MSEASVERVVSYSGGRYAAIAKRNSTFLRSSSYPYLLPQRTQRAVRFLGEEEAVPVCGTGYRTVSGGPETGDGAEKGGFT